MATLLEINQLAVPEGELLARFEGAMLKASWDVMHEDAGTSNHTNRIALAKKVILNMSNLTKQYYRLFLSNATIQTSGDESSDSDIEFVVNSFYNMVANEEAA